MSRKAISKHVLSDYQEKQINQSENLKFKPENSEIQTGKILKLTQKYQTQRPKSKLQKSERFKKKKKEEETKEEKKNNKTATTGSMKNSTRIATETM